MNGVRDPPVVNTGFFLPRYKNSWMKTLKTQAQTRKIQNKLESAFFKISHHRRSNSTDSKLFGKKPALASFKGRSY